jgi:hypothetical protein
MRELSDRSREQEHPEDFGAPYFVTAPRQREAGNRGNAQTARADNSAAQIVREIGIALLVPLLGAWVVGLILSASGNY